MTNKPTVSSEPKKQQKDPHPGMMGDGTEEQNLNQPGVQGARIKEEEAAAAFGKKEPPAKSK